jgi:hypothetical protein
MQWAKRMPYWGGGRNDAHGGIYFLTQRQIKAYQKDDAPPLCVKPVSIVIIIFIMAQSYGDTRDVAETAILDMICVAFFALLCLGEYNGTLYGDAALKIEDVSLFVQGRKLDFEITSDAETKPSTSASYTSTTKKNNNRNEKVVQGFSGDPWCCPFKATVQQILHHHSHKYWCNVPCASYCQGNR